MPDVPWWVWLAAALPALIVAGRLDRRVERARFHFTLRSHGYGSHGDYVGGPEWKHRRRVFLTGRGVLWCRVCRRAWQPRWPVHHKDYARAGAGQELDRDLIPVCRRCHTFVHVLDRKRGPLRGLGFSLRATTWVAIGLWLPVRLARRVFAGVRDAAAGVVRN